MKYMHDDVHAVMAEIRRYDAQNYWRNHHGITRQNGHWPVGRTDGGN